MAFVASSARKAIAGWRRGEAGRTVLWVLGGRGVMGTGGVRVEEKELRVVQPPPPSCQNSQVWRQGPAVAQQFSLSWA